MKIVFIFVFVNYCSLDGSAANKFGSGGAIGTLDKIKQQKDKMFGQPENQNHVVTNTQAQAGNQYQPQAGICHPCNCPKYRNSAALKSTGWIITCAISLTLTKLIF